MEDRVRQWAIAVGLVVLIAGCVPTMSTIGGHNDAELETWAHQARALCIHRTGQAPASAFTTDGCTLWPNGTWQSCCVDHDMVYWCGGSATERRLADEQLRRCIAERGGGSLDTIM